VSDLANKRIRFSSPASQLIFTGILLVFCIVTSDQKQVPVF